MEPDYLNLKGNFTQTDNENWTEDSPTFENNRHAIDWSNPVYNKFRSFNIKAIRDIFFSLLNNSRCQQRVCDSEENIVKLWKKCESLTEECKRLEARMYKNKLEHEEQLQRFRDEVKMQNNANDE